MSRDGDFDGDFYVGYRQTAPAALGRFLRRVTIGLLLGAVAVAGLATAAQGPFGDGVFEFGEPRELTGIVLGEPLPQLLVREDGGGAWVHHPLVARGKHGAAAPIAGHAGEMVRLSATRIRRDGITMLELVPGSIERTRETLRIADLGRGVDLGRRTLHGEIVDAKCWLGVMKPAAGKPHRACASLCIRGGVPAALLSGEGEDRSLYLLVDDGGGPVGPRLLDRVAEPVTVTGRVSRHGDLLVLAAEPKAFRRIDRREDV